MPVVDWKFPTILIGAMLLGVALTYLQMRAYNSELNRALHSARGEHLMLVSGRGRSFRGGAILIAVVDTIQRDIIIARAMTGATVFRRFTDVPQLLGPITGAAGRVRNKQLRSAVEMAMAQVKLPASAEDNPPLKTVASDSQSPRWTRRHDAEAEDRAARNPVIARMRPIHHERNN